MIETHAFVAHAKAERMTDAEREAAIAAIAASPLAGDLVVGSGGCRKVRIAGRGKGKSGGYRIVTYFVDPQGVYLLALLSKASRPNFSDAEVAAMAIFAKTLTAKPRP